MWIPSSSLSELCPAEFLDATTRLRPKDSPRSFVLSRQTVAQRLSVEGLTFFYGSVQVSTMVPFKASDT